MKSVLKHVPQINQNEHNFFLTDRLLSLSLPSSLLMFCDSLYVGSFTISVYIGGGSSLSVSTGIGQSPGSYGGGGASSAVCVPVAGVVVIVALGVVSVLVSVSWLLTVSASSSVDNYMEEKKLSLTMTFKILLKSHNRLVCRIDNNDHIAFPIFY